jgi:TonB-dependent SusC/RagA subfamily outer membrane receptor
MPILGATVVEKGTTNGVSTGIDGDYAIRAAGPESVIEVSYVGYKTVSLVASSSLLAHLTLEEDAMGIDDVVVIGYGTVKKNDMTGSVVAIKAEEFNRGAVVSTQDMLKGKVPGVHIIPGDGGPGSSATIRVRGAASLNASNDPLIVIDGVPIAVDGGKGMANPLETINPNDIESFTVLKDASAAAIYGSRASNGVILVTTKKGRGNTPRVSYSGSVSVQTNSDELPVMSPGEFRTYIDQVYPAGTTTGDKVQSMLGDKNTNWQDLVFRTAISHDHNVSLIGNINDRMPYRASVGYTNQQGTLETSKYERGTLDLSLSPNFFDKHLTVNLNAKGVITSQRYASGGVVGSAAFFNPTIDPYFRNDDGSIDYTTTNGYWNYGSGRGEDFTPNTLLGAGPLSQLYDRDNTARAKRFIGNAQIDYKVHGFEALRFNLNLGLDVSSAKTYDGVNPGSFQAYTDTEARGWGQYSWTTNFRRNQLLEFYANFNKEWGIHHLDVMAGYSWQHFYSSDHSVSYFNETHEQKGEDSRYPFNRQENYLLSFYGRLNYSIASKYLFSFTLRDDASSRFSKDTRWGLFPSGAFAWNIAEENFLKDSRAVSALKLRVSVGQTGQQEIGSNYPYLARYYMSTDVYKTYYMGSAGHMFYLTPGAYDPNIKWETTTTYNVGLDFGFLGGHQRQRRLVPASDGRPPEQRHHPHGLELRQHGAHQHRLDGEQGRGVQPEFHPRADQGLEPHGRLQRHVPAHRVHQAQQHRRPRLRHPGEQHHQGYGQPAPAPHGGLCTLHLLLLPAGLRPGRQADPERIGGSQQERPDRPGRPLHDRQEPQPRLLLRHQPQAELQELGLRLQRPRFGGQLGLQRLRLGQLDVQHRHQRRQPAQLRTAGQEDRLYEGQQRRAVVFGHVPRKRFVLPHGRHQPRVHVQQDWQLEGLDARRLRRAERIRHHRLQRRRPRNTGRQRHRRLDLAAPAHLFAASECKLLKTNEP